MKNSVKKITALSACVLSAAMCIGSFAACKKDKDNDADKTPVHTAAQAATCTAAGNTEYWVKGGKYYSDEACTTEITQASTVINALGHDFDSAAYVTTDDTWHWKVCARGCGELSTKVKHNFDNGDCVCGKAAPVEHVAAQAATCGKDGNIEYWVKGGKYYSNEACTTEITQAQTVIAKTGNHTAASEYTKEEYKHYHVCTVCGDPADAKEDHSFTNGTCTVCGKTNGFENTAVDGSLTREDTATSVKVTVGATTADYEAKFNYTLSGLEVGDAYVIKYKLTSSAAGSVNFETYDDDKNNAFNIAVKEDEQVLTVYGVLRNAANTTAVLKVGALAGAVLEFTSITCEKLNGTADLSDYGFFKHDDIPVENISRTFNADKTSFNVTGSGDGEAWHLKIEKSQNYQQGKTYDMVYVVKVNSMTGSHNTKFVSSVADFTGGKRAGLVR